MTDNEMFTLSVSTEVFWAAIFGAYFVMFCGILALRNAREQRTEHSGDNWQMEALSGFVGALAPIWIGLFLFLLYLLGKLAWNIPSPATFEQDPTVSLLSKQPSSEAAFAEAIRWHILAFVGLLTALGGLITLPLAMIRVLTTERQVRAVEEGLITDRINKAVEGLGAEKTTSYRGRFVHWKEKEGPMDQRNGFIEKWGEAADIKDRLPDWLKDLSEAEIDEKELVEFGDWTDITQTEPNLEVRIGAIFALERIAQDSERDHIQIMEILCAYIRQNAGRENVAMPPDGSSPDDWEEWAEEVSTQPRLDVDMAHKVISQRSEARKAHEEKQNWCLNLKRANLRGLVLEGSNLHRADMRHAQLQGVYLGDAELHRTDLWGAELQRADLPGANLREAELGNAKLQGADLRGAELQRASLFLANLHEANLTDAGLQGTDLMHAEFDAHTDLSGASLRGAMLRSVDFTNLPQITPHLKEVFFDGSVTLPGGITSDMDDWPDDRPREELDEGFSFIFDLESSPLYQDWRDWQREHHPDTLPENLR